MHRTRLAAGTAIAAITALTLAGCTGGDSRPSGKIEGTVTLQTWSLTPKYTDYLNGVISAFEAKYPGTKVTLLDQPGEGYSEKVLSQAATEQLPDVINLPPDFALPLAQQGLLEDVSKTGDLAKTYFAGAVDAFRYEGISGVYGYPWYLGTDVSYWNKSQLDGCGLNSAAPPKNTAELFAQAKVMHEHCPDTYLMSRLPGLGDFTVDGIKILSDDGKKFVFATPEAEKLVDSYAEAFKNGYMPPSVLNDDYLGNATLFKQGKVAWTTGGSTAINDFVKENPSLEGNVAITPALSVPPLWVQGVSVSKKSKNLATAIALAEFLTNAENQNAFGHLANIFPSTIASLEDPYYSKDDGTPAGQARIIAFAALKQAKVLTPYTVNDAMNDYFKQQLSLAISGQSSSHDALAKAQERMNQLLAKQ